MNEQELREKIVEFHKDCGYKHCAKYKVRDRIGVFDCDHCYADQVLALFSEAGYKSPEECVTCNQRQIESGKMLNREAASDERQLLDEVKYWKGQAGGK